MAGWTRRILPKPSGLTTDGQTLYVADSEVSALRRLPLNGKGEVTTLVGVGLFEFGDVAYSPSRRLALGFAEPFTYRLQHALGVTCVDGKVYIADTYNSKIEGSRSPNAAHDDAD